MEYSIRAMNIFRPRKILFKTENYFNIFELLNNPVKFFVGHFVERTAIHDSCKMVRAPAHNVAQIRTFLGVNGLAIVGQYAGPPDQ